VKNRQKLVILCVLFVIMLGLIIYQFAR